MASPNFLAIILSYFLLLSISTVDGKIAQKFGCDIFKGNWVYDNSYPLYDSRQCPFIETQFDCQKNGRPDKEYMKYRWQPSGCPLPRFNGVDFLRKIRGKKLIFVGDSLSLNQWQSLTCLLHTALPLAPFTSHTLYGLSTFYFPGYDASLLFYRNAFLVDLVDKPNEGRVLLLDSITNSRVWGEMDILVFDTWHWWLHTGRKQPWEWIAHGNKVVEDMDRLVAYEIALNTWANWIDTHVDPSKTQVFFQGVSPDHFSGIRNCGGHTRPLAGGGGPAVPAAELVLQKILNSMATPVQLLDVTALSQLRIDAHPSFYGGHGVHAAVDCTHWCLTGLPDIWNHFLYAMLR
ncbi:protein trichome birefringence-like 43 isoform X2 [Andrographis paniculata]|uniref:protein trichome birefringence-like 43 isoform X2 n=1 Tax=Andrographis paniculata TaxID=175694 RepID=UPI0021E821B1|nr:protein trichome birefringence-like 43 isoform X2 [Andrographis paniculata]